MADNQPAQNPAPEPDASKTPAQEPENKPADNQPAAQPTDKIVLTDEHKSYLKGQGLSDEDLTKPEAILKIINHAQSSQKTAAQIKAEYDKVKSIVSPQEDKNTNPLVKPATSSDTKPDEQPTNKGIDQVTAFTLSSNLANNFPEIKDDLISGKFYHDMEEMGVPLTRNGEVNLNAILKFAEKQQKEKQLEAKLEEFNKPGNIPAAKPADNQPADDAPMTKQMALAILSQDPNHARAQEAKDFIQKSV